VPETPLEQDSLLIDAETRLNDLKTVLERTKDHRYAMLAKVGLSVEQWTAQVVKDKAVYATMNLFNFDTSHKCLIAEAWCPVNDVEKVHASLRRATVSAGSSVPAVVNVVKTRETPPTYFRTDDFTAGFQSIVDSYGMARYKEFNPGNGGVGSRWRRGLCLRGPLICVI
jgi:V-type H+-transporting ATPase subunit a